MAKMAKILLAFVAVVAIAEVVIATTYTVGAPNGSWDLQTNYTKWAEANTFHPGDTLTFTYSSSQHDVLEVTQVNYDSCSTTNPIATHNDGNTVITLSAVGTRYFICGFSGHCGAGQKVQINVVSGSPSAPAPSSGGPTPPSSVPSTPGSTSPVASPPAGNSPPDSGATTVTAGAGLLVGLAALLAF
ncbi:early nodulin-like protein 1 [Rhynchospora pubera]|uniref:Early nodulin-like protein 1 n=1 Tax=Rhynchospora pubera TaxID=906938 RepID=A0AAV8EX09_9POAL|nr:early nodulin-like protein 1 [Rhynchospora pubera]